MKLFLLRFLRHLIVYDLKNKTETFLIVYKWIYSSNDNTAYEFDISEYYDIKSFGHLFISTFGRFYLIKISSKNQIFGLVNFFKN